MAQKHVYDVRGKQTMIFRLYASDKEGLLHMLFYRLAIIVAFITIVSMIWSVWTSGNLLNFVSQRLIIVVGVLFTPQLFESMKAFSLIVSGGIVFGMLNPSFLHYGVKKHGIYQLYKLIPYIVTAIWIIGLVYLAMLWSI